MTYINVMGCGKSNPESHANLTAEQGADILDSYLRIERDIWLEEKKPPAPSLGHSMVKLEKLNNELENSILDLSNNRELIMTIPGSMPDLDNESLIRHSLEGIDDSIRRAISELNLNLKPDLAAEHEEFLATLTRKAMKQHKVIWMNRMKRDTEDEVSRLSDKVQHLQRLYEQQDTILTNIIGSSTSPLEVELDRIRSYRDTLHSGELSWKDGATLARAAASLSRSGHESWLKIEESLNGDTRFRHAMETRNSLQEAALCIQTAQNTLPGVQFPYCTSREMTALLQVLEYLFTDMNIPDRYKHAAKVYESFQKRSNALFQWIKKMMEETIQKDVNEVDQKYSSLSTKLCNERANAIRNLAGLGSSKGYDPENLTHRIREEYDRKLASSLHRTNVAKIPLREPYK